MWGKETRFRLASSGWQARACGRSVAPTPGAEDPGSLSRGFDAWLMRPRGAIGDGFGVEPEQSAVGRAPARSLGAVARMRSMRWLQAQRSSSRGENGQPCRAALRRQRVRSQAGLGSIGRGEVAISFRLAGLPILGRPARLGCDTAEEVVSHRGAQTAAEHALRLGAQELRPGRANAPRCRPEARAAQHGRDRRRGDADPELQQLTLDAHVAPPRVLPR